MIFFFHFFSVSTTILCCVMCGVSVQHQAPFLLPASVCHSWMVWVTRRSILMLDHRERFAFRMEMGRTTAMRIYLSMWVSLSYRNDLQPNLNLFYIFFWEEQQPQHRQQIDIEGKAHSGRMAVNDFARQWQCLRSPHWHRYREVNISVSSLKTGTPWWIILLSIDRACKDRSQCTHGPRTISALIHARFWFCHRAHPHWWLPNHQANCTTP